MTRPKFLLFSRWGEQLGELHVTSAVHRQEINATDQLDITVSEPLAKGDKVLWTDGMAWFEHTVDEESQTHDGGETFMAVCQSSMQTDLALAHVRLWVAKGITAQEALETVLAQTAWGVDEVGDFGTADITFERQSVYEALCSTAGAFGAEMQPVLHLDDFGVVSRSVRLVKAIGSDDGVRFEYGHGMKGVTKNILSDEVYTACYGYGTTLDTETDGVTDRLWCLVEDEEAKRYWGVPDGKGGVMHAYGVYENSDVDDADILRSETASFLATRNRPSVSYETDIPFASLMGAALGDTVQVVDEDFTPELRLEARIGSITRDVLSGTTSSATFGTVTSVMPDVLARAYTASNAAVRAAEGVSAASIMVGMNAIYSTGGSFVCQTAEGGIITSNVALKSDGNPADASCDVFAVQMSGGKIRVASSVDSTGTWEWSDAFSYDSVSVGGAVLTVQDGSLLFNGKKVAMEG